MTIYNEANLGDPLSAIEINDDTQDEAIRSLERGTTEPVVKPAGLMWASANGTLIAGAAGASHFISTPALALMQWTGSAWQVVHDLAHPALNTGGTAKMQATLDLNNENIANLAAATLDHHAVRKDQTFAASGGIIDVGSNVVRASGVPSDPNDLARLADLSGAVGGFQLQYFQNSASTRVYSTPDNLGTPVNETPFIPEGVLIIAQGRMHDISAGMVIGTNRGPCRLMYLVPAARPNGSYQIRMPGTVMPDNFAGQGSDAGGATTGIGSGYMAVAGGGTDIWVSASKTQLSGGSPAPYEMWVVFHRGSAPYGFEIRFRKTGPGTLMGLFDEVAGEPNESSTLQVWCWGLPA